jgi:divalent metal cation (Fe/Co/Zn/Cd) transporter
VQHEQPRPDHVASAIRWSFASIGWAVIAGFGSLAGGLASDSTALVGFGLSSLVDGTASCVLVWRFRHEQLETRPTHELERRAARVIGVILLLVALYVGTRAVIALSGHSGPETTALGVALAGASILVLPVLSRAKLRLSRLVNSQALRADGVLSGAGAGLAAAVLISLALEAQLDWWWADSVAAIVIAAVLLRESSLSVRSASRL